MIVVSDRIYSSHLKPYQLIFIKLHQINSLDQRITLWQMHLPIERYSFIRISEHTGFISSATDMVHLSGILSLN